MHEIEPYYNWRGNYVAADDPESPFSIESTVNLLLQILSTIS